MRVLIGDAFLGLRGAVKMLLLRNTAYIVCVCVCVCKCVCVSAEGHIHVDVDTGKRTALLQTPVTAAANTGK